MRTTMLVLLLLLSSAALAQRGLAPNGYYPASYRGDTFTGTAVKFDPATDTLTLEFRKGTDAQVMELAFEQGCFVPSRTGEPMHAKDIAPGTVLTAFYMPKTVTRDGTKQKVQVVIGIRFLEWQGKPVSEENRRKLYTCSAGSGWRYFRAFAGAPGAAALSPLEIVVPGRK